MNITLIGISNMLQVRESYPSHLKEKRRLEVVKAYVLHELASLTNDKDKSVFKGVIDDLVNKCMNSDEKSVEDNCKEIYDLFYGLSLMFKRKFIAREITSEAYKWELKYIPLKQLMIDADIEVNGGNLRKKTIGELLNNPRFCKGVRDIGRNYEKMKARLADDPIIVVEEGNKYRILDGHGRAFYKLHVNNCNVDGEIRAYVGIKSNEGKEANICIPFGIQHFISEYFHDNKLLEKLKNKIKKIIRKLRTSTTLINAFNIAHPEALIIVNSGVVVTVIRGISANTMGCPCTVNRHSAYD